MQSDTAIPELIPLLRAVGVALEGMAGEGRHADDLGAHTLTLAEKSTSGLQSYSIHPYPL